MKILTNLGWVHKYNGVTELAAYIKILNESTMLETIYARNTDNFERSKFWQIVGWACVIEHVHITVHQKGNQLNYQLHTVCSWSLVYK